MAEKIQFGHHVSPANLALIVKQTGVTVARGPWKLAQNMPDERRASHTGFSDGLRVAFNRTALVQVDHGQTIVGPIGPLAPQTDLNNRWFRTVRSLDLSIAAV